MDENVGMTDGGFTVKFSDIEAAIRHFIKVTKRWKNSGKLFYAKIYVHQESIKEDAPDDFYQGKTIVEMQEYYEHSYTMKSRSTIDSYGGVTFGGLEIEDSSVNTLVIWKPKNVFNTFITSLIFKWIVQNSNSFYIVNNDNEYDQLKEGAPYYGLY